MGEPVDVDALRATTPAATSTAQPIVAGQVDRVVKKVLPEDVPNVAKDARVAMHKAANITLLMLSAMVQDQGRSRRTVTAADVKQAMTHAGFGHLIDGLDVKRPR